MAHGSRALWRVVHAALADLVERLALQSIDDSLAPCPLGFLEVLAEGIHALQSNQRLIHERTRQ